MYPTPTCTLCAHAGCGSVTPVSCAHTGTVCYTVTPVLLRRGNGAEGVCPWWWWVRTKEANRPTMLCILLHKASSLSRSSTGCRLEERETESEGGAEKEGGRGERELENER